MPFRGPDLQNGNISIVTKLGSVRAISQSSKIETRGSHMNEDFKTISEKMPDLLEKLLACSPHSSAGKMPSDIPLRGVYLFSKADRYYYVGRTNRLKARFREHLNGRNNDAPFAFKIARHATGHLKAKGGKRRAELENDPTFRIAFAQAKDDLRQMEWRWVQVDDPNTQCLLEIYAAIALKAEFNDFENH